MAIVPILISIRSPGRPTIRITKVFVVSRGYLNATMSPRPSRPNVAVVNAHSPSLNVGSIATPATRIGRSTQPDDKRTSAITPHRLTHAFNPLPSFIRARVLDFATYPAIEQLARARKFLAFTSIGTLAAPRTSRSCRFRAVRQSLDLMVDSSP